MKIEICINKYFFLVRYPVDKSTMSKIVEIQPCMGYRFAIETLEKNALGNIK